MPRKLRRLNGEQFISALKRCGFAEVSRRGSHAKLRRVTSDGIKQTLTVPVHSALAIGALSAVVNQASQYLTQEEVDREFYVI